jgi:hypothetical protein
MSHSDNCPDRYTVRRQAERDADFGRHRYRPYDCDESNREYSRQINYAEERLEEERAAQRSEQRHREQRYYEQQQEEQEYYAMLDQQAWEEEEAFYAAISEQRNIDERNASDWENEGGFIVPIAETEQRTSDEIPF